MTTGTAITRTAVALLAAVTLSAGAAGCASRTGTDAAEAPETPATTTSVEPLPASMTLHAYITKNKIAEVPIKDGEPGTPTFEFPFPPGWSDAGDQTPDWAYGAIVYDKPQDPADPPVMYAIASKLTGNADAAVDAAKVLELAPAQLDGLDQFTPLGEPERTQLSGFDAILYEGTYVNEGKTRAVAQMTVAIPGKDGLFVLQLNSDALQAEQDVVIEAAKLIDEQTKITAPA